MGDNLPAVDLGDNTVGQVAAGQSHTCVLLTSGDVACWGYNGFGQASGVEVSRLFSSPFRPYHMIFCFGWAAPQGSETSMFNFRSETDTVASNERHATQDQERSCRALSIFEAT